MVGAVWRTLRERLSGLTPTRLTGPPTSSNGASSLHLFWDGPPRPLTEVSATIEVIEPPTVERLYFWAVQVSFQRSDGSTTGGAHVGLQHHPAYPGAGAVNWGGYLRAGGEIDGSVSALPSTLDNVNMAGANLTSARLGRLIGTLLLLYRPI